MDVQLTPELKEKLKKAGVLGFQLKSTFPYVPKIYRREGLPKELWPIFFLRGLDGVETAGLEDEMHGSVTVDSSNGTSVKINSAKVRVKTVKLGVISWKNFRDSDGNLIPSPAKDSLNNGITEDGLRYLPPSLQVELCNAITEHSTLTDEELLGLEL
jgi:hypothetical protein